MNQSVKAYTLRIPWSIWRDLVSISRQTGISVADILRAFLKRDIEYVKGGGKIEL